MKQVTYVPFLGIMSIYANYISWYKQSLIIVM